MKQLALGVLVFCGAIWFLMAWRSGSKRDAAVADVREQVAVIDLSSAYRWLPQEEVNEFADELCSHLRAAAEVLRSRVLKYRELIDLHGEERLDAVVYLELFALEKYLAGRRAGKRLAIDLDEAEFKAWLRSFRAHK